MTSSSAFKIDCGSMDRLVASQVRPCQANLMLVSHLTFVSADIIKMKR